jgi:NADPH:quinone reductase-like Zn-dependent oxidoreductase
MQAWILDESPGGYRWGEIAVPELGPDDVQVRVVASALNHMDLWVTRGMPKPPLPHVPGCDVAGVVEAIGSDVTNVQLGDEVVINPGVSPVADIVALGNDSPMGPGFMIYGEHCWGGHATFAIAPSRNVRVRPPAAAGPNAPPTRWPTSPPTACCAVLAPALATPCWSWGSAPGSRAPRSPSPGTWAAPWWPPVAARPSGPRHSS